MVNEQQSSVGVSSGDPGVQRAHRAKLRAKIKVDIAVARFKDIERAYVAAQLGGKDGLHFFLLMKDLDVIWNEFRVENDTYLTALIELDLLSEFQSDLEVEMRSLYCKLRSYEEIFNREIQVNPKPVSQVGDLELIHQVEDHVAVEDLNQLNVLCHNVEATTNQVTNGAVLIDNNIESVNSSVQNQQSTISNPTHQARLPDIPLPVFDGLIHQWPMFRDRFLALIHRRVGISDSERFYYLIGCIRGEASDVIKGIIVSDNNYHTAWNRLLERFNKPRQLARDIVESLITEAPFEQENLHSLKQFLAKFSDGISMLQSLDIPDLGQFLLFALSTRCLPLTTRKLFESGNTLEYPTEQDVLKFVRSRISVLENAGSLCPSFQKEKFKVFKKPTFKEDKRTTSLLSTKSGGKSCKCVICSGSHLVGVCRELLSMPYGDRVSAVRKHRLCFNCLSDQHWSDRCKMKNPCEKCKRKHHTLLHRDSTVEEDNNGGNTSNNSILLGSQISNTVILGTALVHVHDYWGTSQTVRVLIDSASQISAITLSCVNKLGLRRKKWTTPLLGLSGVSVPAVEGVVECLLHPRYDPSTQLHVQAWILNKITTSMPCRQLPTSVKQSFCHLALADPSFDQPGTIDMLLGADHFAEIMDGKRMNIQKHLPTAFGSIFGWVLIGNVPKQQNFPKQALLSSLTVSLEDMLQSFWTLEEPKFENEEVTEDSKCESIFQKLTHRDSQGRFLVPLPFRFSDCTERLRGSRQAAVRRFENLEKRLKSDDQLYNSYKQFMYEYEELGHMTPTENPGLYYIPHHPVVKKQGQELKIRVVFDASAKTQGGCSLNDCLLAGPKLQRDIIDILVNFRLHQFVFTADICKMYRQILLRADDRPFQHILWRDSSVKKLQEYELNTVTYGVNAAPFLAMRVLQQISDDDAQEYPLVQRALQEHTYVDDICVGSDTIQSIVNLKSNLITVLAKSGMELKKWSSNLSEIMDCVAPDDRATGNCEFDSLDASTTKVLGLVWDPTDDHFQYNITLDKQVVTKRGILSTIARIFDPLGILAPVIFIAKCIMQRLWKLSIAWDESLPEDLKKEWNCFLTELPFISNIRFPRYTGLRPNYDIQLCGFGDESTLG